MSRATSETAATAVAKTILSHRLRGPCFYSFLLASFRSNITTDNIAHASHIHTVVFISQSRLNEFVKCVAL